MSNWIKYIAIAAGGWWIYNKAKSAAVMTSVDLSIAGFRFSGSNVILQLLIKNPRNAGLSITGIDADVYIGTVKMGNLTSLAAVEVPPAGTVVLELVVRASVLNVVDGLRRLLSGSTGLNTPIRVVGVIQVNGLDIPVDVLYSKKVSI